MDKRAYEGQGYAWAAEDYSGTATIGTPDNPTGSYAFAVEYSRAYRLYHAEKLTHMTSVQAAYRAWQASGGRTIWAETADDKKYQRAVTADWCEQHKAATSAT